MLTLSSFLNKIPIVAGLIILLICQGLALAAEKTTEPAIPFAIATVHFEQNATDGDMEVVFEVKGNKDGLSKLAIVSPDGRKVIDFTAPDASTIGIRQFSFESPEPKDTNSLKAAYPEGIYTFSGSTFSGQNLTAQSRLSHRLPAKATIKQPGIHVKSVDVDEVKITWAAMKNISSVIIEIKQDELDVSMKAKQSGSETAFCVPSGFLAPNTEYELGVGTVSEEGNIVFVETTFMTAKNN